MNFLAQNGHSLYGKFWLHPAAVLAPLVTGALLSQADAGTSAWYAAHVLAGCAAGVLAAALAPLWVQTAAVPDVFSPPPGSPLAPYIAERRGMRASLAVAAVIAALCAALESTQEAAAGAVLVACALAACQQAPRLPFWRRWPSRRKPPSGPAAKDPARPPSSWR